MPHDELEHEDTQTGIASQAGKAAVDMVPYDLVTARQLSTLISTAIPLLGFLRSLPEDNGTTSAAADGGGKLATEQTLTRICDRIEKLVSDDTRWGLDQYKRLEDAFIRAYKSSAEFNRQQAISAASIRLPHFKFRPAFARTPQGHWIAYYGDLQSPGNLIYGVGLTVDDAVAAFDINFQNTNLPALSNELLNSLTPNEMDTRRTGQNSNDASNPSDSGRNRQSPRKNKKLREKSDPAFPAPPPNDSGNLDFPPTEFPDQFS